MRPSFGLVVDLAGTATSRTGDLLSAMAVVAETALNLTITAAAGTSDLTGTTASAARMCHLSYLLPLIFFVIPAVSTVVHGLLME